MANLKFSFAFLLLVYLSSNKVFAQQHGSSWTAPKYADDIKNPLHGNAKATADGMKLFKSMCIICHGENGNGNGVAGVALKPKPADFLALKVRNESDGALFWKMTEGKPPMASYKTLLTENQRWQLVNYIRKLESTHKTQ